MLPVRRKQSIAGRLTPLMSTTPMCLSLTAFRSLQTSICIIGIVVVSTRLVAEEKLVTRINAAIGGCGFAREGVFEDGISVQIDDDPDGAFEGLSRLDMSTLSAITTLTLRKPCKRHESASVIAKMSSLTTLDVSDKSWNRTLSHVVANSKTIEDIWAEASGIEREDLRLVAKAKQLRVLMIGGNPLRSGDLDYLAGLNNLTQLSVAGINISAEDLRCVAHLKSLKWLSLKGCSSVDNGIIPIVDNCEQLSILTLVGTRVTREGAQKIRTRHPRAIISMDTELVAPGW